MLSHNTQKVFTTENKRKDNSLGPILEQYYLHRHSVSITNILKITGLVKYCPLLYTKVYYMSFLEQFDWFTLTIL